VASPRIRSHLDERIELHRAAGKRLKAPAILALWHLTSLDAPTVALVWTWAFAWAVGVKLSPWILLLVAFVTWTVYACDRILDARHATRTGDLTILRDRHYFHWRHRGKFMPIAALTGTASALAIFCLIPFDTRAHDSVIAAAALAYFSGVHLPVRFPARLSVVAPKELLVGLLFTAGCAAPALSRLHWTQAAITSLASVLACIAFFAVLAWLNCAAIASWESSCHRLAIQTQAALICSIGLALGLAVSFLLQKLARPDFAKHVVHVDPVNLR